ncbi:hypothetical protein [Penaeicola halotolerans]|uniref:hypothetical protein n=1 Tax=Penaeicola halotolerans TaxID=2793196 RepID=UPI001CF90016|nr:hypothetical protein [Penaeicola halotolerans]
MKYQIAGFFKDGLLLKFQWIGFLLIGLVARLLIFAYGLEESYANKVYGYVDVNAIGVVLLSILVSYIRYKVFPKIGSKLSIIAFVGYLITCVYLMILSAEVNMTLSVLFKTSLALIIIYMSAIWFNKIMYMKVEE